MDAPGMLDSIKTLVSGNDQMGIGRPILVNLTTPGISLSRGARMMPLGVVGTINLRTYLRSSRGIGLGMTGVLKTQGKIFRKRKLCLKV